MPLLLLAFLEAIPAFIKALPDIMRVVIKLMGLVEKLAQSKHLAETEATIDQLISADTEEKKRQAARSMFDLIRKFG